jgi:hypothetical protein
VIVTLIARLNQDCVDEPQASFLVKHVLNRFADQSHRIVTWFPWFTWLKHTCTLSLHVVHVVHMAVVHVVHGLHVVPVVHVASAL